MLYFALMQTGLGPSTMAKKAYVNFGFLQVQRGTILLSFSSFAGVMAAQHYDFYYYHHFYYCYSNYYYYYYCCYYYYYYYYYYYD